MLGPDAKLEESDDDEGAGEGGASREDVVATIIGNNVGFSRTRSIFFITKMGLKVFFSKGGYDFFIEPDPDDMEGHQWIEAETRGLTCGTEENDKMPKNASKEIEHKGHEELQDETTLKYSGVSLIFG